MDEDAHIYILGKKQYPGIGHYQIRIEQDSLYEPITPITIE